MNLEDSILTLAASIEKLAFALEKGFIVAEVPKVVAPEPTIENLIDQQDAIAEEIAQKIRERDTQKAPTEKKTRAKKTPPIIPGCLDVTPKPWAEDLPVPDPDPEPIPESFEPPVTPLITNDQIREALVALSDKTTKETARKLLANIGKAATISQVAPEHRVPLMAAIEEAMNAKG